LDHVRGRHCLFCISYDGAQALTEFFFLDLHYKTHGVI
jgi:hypothetical protein